MKPVTSDFQDIYLSLTGVDYMLQIFFFFGLPGFKQCYSRTNAVFFLHGSLDGSNGGFADDQTVMSFLKY